MVEDKNFTGKIIGSVSSCGVVVIGMSGPYVVFDSQEAAADYLESYAKALREYAPRAKRPPLEASEKP